MERRKRPCWYPVDAGREEPERTARRERMLECEMGARDVIEVDGVEA